jgi:hypothetical protein
MFCRPCPTTLAVGTIRCFSRQTIGRVLSYHEASPAVVHSPTRIMRATQTVPRPDIWLGDMVCAFRFSFVVGMELGTMSDAVLYITRYHEHAARFCLL